MSSRGGERERDKEFSAPQFKFTEKVFSEEMTIIKGAKLSPV